MPMLAPAWVARNVPTGSLVSGASSTSGGLIVEAFAHDKEHRSFGEFELFNHIDSVLLWIARECRPACRMVIAAQLQAINAFPQRMHATDAGDDASETQRLSVCRTGCRPAS
ncbi:hypothetical protein XAB3213_1170013 [Xanthomonas citri pv. bilvae]|nr:hypothetical protein XAB3213_1170013 [Xanthomonas citri pv. bilvae]